MTREGNRRFEKALSTGSVQGTTYIGRDSLGNVTWLQEPETELIAGDHKITEFAFDAMSRMTLKKMFKRVGHSGSNYIELGIAYNDNPGGGRGQVITRTDGLGNTSVYEYDLAGRLVRRKLPGFNDVTHRKIWDYTYDLEGRLKQWVDGNNAIVMLGYDGTTKQLEKRWLAAVGSQVLSETLTNEKFAYDALERPYRAETFWWFFGDANGPNPAAQLLVRADSNMDGFGRTLNETFGYLDAGGGAPAVSKSNVSEWGAGGGSFGFRTALTNASGFRLEFAPDAAKKLSQIDMRFPGSPLSPAAPDITGLASYEYEGARRIHRSVNLDGSTNLLTTDYSFDSLRHLTRSETKYAGAPRYDLQLQRDLVGNVLHLQQEKLNPGFPSRVGDVFELDGYDRLVNAKLGVDSLSTPSQILTQVGYQLDAAHNREEVVTEGGAGIEHDYYSRTAGTNEYEGRITPETGETIDFTYDGNGNLISDGFYLYEYDYLDRLSKIYLITYPAGVSSGSSSLRCPFGKCA